MLSFAAGGFSVVMATLLGVAASSGSEALDEHAVAQAPVAHGHGIAAQLVHHGPDDHGSREDDLGPFGLESHDRSTGLGVPAPVELDLAVDLGPVQHRPVD